MVLATNELPKISSFYKERLFLMDALASIIFHFQSELMLTATGSFQEKQRFPFALFFPNV